MAGNILTEHLMGIINHSYSLLQLLYNNYVSTFVYMNTFSAKYLIQFYVILRCWLFKYFYIYTQ